MTSVRISIVMIFLASSLFPITASYAEEDSPKQPEAQDVVLTPADLLILEAIEKTNERIDNLAKDLNDRIDNLNMRIDNLWITMLGGFLGVMAFIGGIVFWDRRTFMRRAREECREEVSGDRKKLEGMLAAMKKLSERFPEVREALGKSGLL